MCWLQLVAGRRWRSMFTRAFRTARPFRCARRPTVAAPERSPTLFRNTVWATLFRWPKSPAGRRPGASIGAAVAHRAPCPFPTLASQADPWALVLGTTDAGVWDPAYTPNAYCSQAVGGTLPPGRAELLPSGQRRSGRSRIQLPEDKRQPLVWRYGHKFRHRDWLGLVPKDQQYEIERLRCRCASLHRERFRWCDTDSQRHHRYV